MVEEIITEKIRLLVDALNKLELEIAIATDVMKEHYVSASQAMPDGKSYFLSGMQTGPVIKSYLLTRRGIEVPGEDVIQVPEFIESVLRFASYPKRKIEVLNDLLAHLLGIDQMIQKAEA
ncbi:MAG: hypothetical protein M3299_10025 [Thermoproteota archaeon]|nr:hypothetical protein [Thermoproteota archaeon]